MFDNWADMSVHLLLLKSSMVDLTKRKKKGPWLRSSEVLLCETIYWIQNNGYKIFTRKIYILLPNANFKRQMLALIQKLTKKRWSYDAWIRTQDHRRWGSVQSNILTYGRPHLILISKVFLFHAQLAEKNVLNWTLALNWCRKHSICQLI